jgi:hypothetical protein
VFTFMSMFISMSMPMLSMSITEPVFMSNPYYLHAMFLLKSMSMPLSTVCPCLNHCSHACSCSCSRTCRCT